MLFVNNKLFIGMLPIFSKINNIFCQSLILVYMITTTKCTFSSYLLEQLNKSIGPLLSSRACLSFRQLGRQVLFSGQYVGVVVTVAAAAAALHNCCHFELTGGRGCMSPVPPASQPIHILARQSSAPRNNQHICLYATIKAAGERMAGSALFLCVWLTFN